MLVLSDALVSLAEVYREQLIWWEKVGHFRYRRIQVKVASGTGSSKVGILGLPDREHINATIELTSAPA